MINLRKKSYHPQNILHFLLLLAITVAVGYYVLYQSRSLMAGPKIAFTNPANGATVRESLTLIEGNAERISFIELNGRQIFTDEFGNFREKLPLLEGHNIIKLQATDRFGRITTQNLYLLYEEE